MALAQSDTVTFSRAAVGLAVAYGALAAACTSSHCRPPVPSEDASADIEVDATPSCTSDRGQMVVGPIVGLSGNADGPCGPLLVTLYDEGGVPLAGFERRCAPEANFIDVGTWPSGRYQLAVAGTGVIGGGGQLIHPDFCRGPEDFWRACSPLWVDVTPCGLSVVPVTLVCDQATLSDCR